MSNEDTFDIIDNPEVDLFNDTAFSLKHKRLSKIMLQGSSVVDGLQFTYDDGKAAPFRGGNGGVKMTLTLEKDEYIQKVEYQICSFSQCDWGCEDAPVLSHLKITTNKNRSVSTGKKRVAYLKQSTLIASAGNQIFALQGAQHTCPGNYLSSISIGYEKNNNLTHFNDLDYAHNKTRVSKIILYGAYIVDGFQFIYDDNKAAPLRGGKGGKKKTLILAKDEYINRVVIRTGTYTIVKEAIPTLCKIVFYTNKNNSISAGEEKSCIDITTTEFTNGGMKITALSGFYHNFGGNYLSSVEVALYETFDPLPQRDKNAKNELRECLRGAYYKRGELLSMYNSTLNSTNKGSLVEQALINKKEYITSYTTFPKTNVLSEQIVFRAILPREIEHLEYGHIYSKAEHRAKRSPIYWDVNKPKIQWDTQNSTQSAYTNILRLLAIQSSYDPASQFVSHALDYETALRFDGNIYAYKIKPRSPLLGLKEKYKIGGEVQFQILGGTEITELYRLNNDKKIWEVYHSGSKASRWFATAKPINLDYLDLTENPDEPDL